MDNLTKVCEATSQSQDLDNFVPSHRKGRKLLAEKRRRARINNCLRQLRNMVYDSEHNKELDLEKMEKAEILEKTLEVLTQLRHSHKSQSSTSSQSTRRALAIRYASGFSSCMQESIKYIQNSHLIPAEVKAHMHDHLKTIARKMEGAEEDGQSLNLTTEYLTSAPDYPSSTDEFSSSFERLPAFCNVEKNADVLNDEKDDENARSDVKVVNQVSSSVNCYSPLNVDKFQNQITSSANWCSPLNEDRLQNGISGSVRYCSPLNHDKSPSEISSSVHHYSPSNEDEFQNQIIGSNHYCTPLNHDKVPSEVSSLVHFPVNQDKSQNQFNTSVHYCSPSNQDKSHNQLSSPVHYYSPSNEDKSQNQISISVRYCSPPPPKHTFKPILQHLSPQTLSGLLPHQQAQDTINHIFCDPEREDAMDHKPLLEKQRQDTIKHKPLFEQQKQDTMDHKLLRDPQRKDTMDHRPSSEPQRKDTLGYSFFLDQQVNQTESSFQATQTEPKQFHPAETESSLRTSPLNFCQPRVGSTNNMYHLSPLTSNPPYFPSTPTITYDKISDNSTIFLYSSSILPATPSFTSQSVYSSYHIQGQAPTIPRIIVHPVQCLKAPSTRDHQLISSITKQHPALSSILDLCVMRDDVPRISAESMWRPW